MHIGYYFNQISHNGIKVDHKSQNYDFVSEVDFKRFVAKVL